MGRQAVLFIINGLGLGNSTRCDSIIEQLNLDAIEVDVLTSGNGLNYFAQKKYIRKLHSLQPLNYAMGSDGKLSIARTLLLAPHIIKCFLANMKTLRCLLKNECYRAIVVDSDYTIALYKWGMRAPVLALNNANVIVEECKKHDRIPSSIWPQYIVEVLDHWFHKLIPNVVLSPSLYPRTSTKKIKQVAPIVRLNLKRVAENIRVQKILIMLSGSVFGTSTDFINNLDVPEGVVIDVLGRQGVSTDKISYYGKVYDNKKFVRDADILVINAGFSAVSEAVVLQKPCVVIPVENHAEQFINAHCIQKWGLGLVANTNNVNEKIYDLISRYQQFLDQHKKFNCSSYGAISAGREIERMVGLYDNLR